MKKVAYILLALVAVALCSCEHKELCFHHPHSRTLKIVYDWEQAPDADPYGMCLFCYPEDGSTPLRFDFQNKEGGEITLNTGKYRFMTYNNDTDGVMFSDMYDFEEHSLYTREGSVLEPLYGNVAHRAPRAEGTEQERVVICPDMMWGCTVIDVVISENEISYKPIILDDNGELMAADIVRIRKSTDNVITLMPHELMCIYTYEVRNVKNLKRMQQMSGTISGMAGDLTLEDEELGRESFTIPFEAYKKDDTTVVGSFITFGHNEKNDKPHKMAFYVIMDDGNKYVYKDSEKYNVTDQVHNAPNHRRVHIIIDGLELPTPITNGTGLTPTVDDWIEENTDIVL